MSEPTSPAGRPRDPFFFILSVLCALAILRLWISPLANSFWLDETLIPWTVRGGFSAIVPRAFISLQSIAFCMVEWPLSLLGGGEVVARLPSVAGALGATWILYRIGREAEGRELGFCFATLFVVNPAVVVQVPDARPYALALFFETAALYFLLAWIRSARWKHGLLWILSAAAATHLHYLFGIAIPVAVVFTLWCIARRRTRISPAHLAFCCAAGVALLLPALPQLRVYAGQRSLLSFLDRPSAGHLLVALLPVYILIALALAAILELLTGKLPRWSAPSSGRDAATLALLLLAIPTVSYFAISRFTSTQLFSARYLLPTAPGLAILWGWLISGIRSVNLRRFSLILVLAVSTFLVGGTALMPDYTAEDWRGAVHALPESGPLLVYSGLVETRHLAWLQVPERWAYFTAPVSAYRAGLTPSDTFVLPFDIDPPGQAYVDGLLVSRLRGEAHVSCILRQSFSGAKWDAWLTARLTAMGFQRQREARFGRIEVVVFRIPDSAAAAPRR